MHAILGKETASSLQPAARFACIFQELWKHHVVAFQKTERGQAISLYLVCC
jgi:hypothetical protein